MSILHQLKTYKPFNEKESLMVLQAIQFVERNPDYLYRSCLSGHVTGGAWIVNKNLTHALLCHHKKLNRWLHLGGHADGDESALTTAVREAKEESGLHVAIFNNSIFDVDVHSISYSKGVPTHLHIDIRYLLTADMDQELIVSEESNALKWVSIDELSWIEGDDSLLRMIEKTKKMK